MKLSGRPKHNYKEIPGHGDSSEDLQESSASKLRGLLEERKLSKSRLFQGDFNMSVQDVVHLLQESDVLTKRLKDQLVFYQESLAGLKFRTEQVVSENEMLHERLKENSLKDDATRSHSTVHFAQNEDRHYLHQLENELDDVKKLNQKKTNQLETIIKSTREELDIYRERVSKLQSQLRSMANDGEQNQDNVCMKCGGLSYFASQPSMVHMKTLDKLTKERDELTETLTKHKSLLEQCHQREFEAYMQVKNSAETAENAKLEKAEAIIKIKQLESGMDEERKRHESLLSSAQEKWKRERDDTKEKYEKEKQTLQAKIQLLTQKCDENDHHLEKLIREKVNLISNLEHSRTELAVSHVDIDKVKEVAKDDLAACTRERVEAQQELLHVKNIHARELKDYERGKIALTTENEALKNRLAEAQSGWLETREENMKTEERLKQLENEFHLLTLTKTNLESAHEQNRENRKKQDEQREQQFVETLQESEEKHAELRKELGEMLQTQMKMSSAIKNENKRLILKLEEKKGNHSSEREKWREQSSLLTRELETSRKQNEEITSEKKRLSQVNTDLVGKVKFLKQENKKALKMIYNLLKKQKELMQDRQTLSHKLEYLQLSCIAGTPPQRYSQEAGNISANKQGSESNTSCSVNKPSNVKINNEDESL
ncbi:serologically defined colon cancer antigen 8-like [Dendronephthya gigantea]|uniref:serologically defined colon cancer antigen 8-like n=1 Tax=Dendronephthya gigantea TaxID=151771 RepID=UPI00106D2AAC|nr:serologically defined colon cancer antigen 8-like [Dendronephthya gigantea]